jgi:Arc/MetJ-type ribon-helix-helix transcriptional regulator
MVRVDSETNDALDSWVQTGAVKSRSEAAALFIREGLRVRADELERLKGALDEVEAARERLRQQANHVFGGEAAPPAQEG